MERHFAEELQKLKQKLFQMGLLVEGAIEKSFEALTERSEDRVKSVLEDEKIINSLEIEIDETGRAYQAVVSAINGRVDAASQSIEIEGMVRGAYPELLPGMSGNAVFKVPRGR